jgi:hypothetical protein
MDKLEHYLDQVCRSIGGPRSLRQHVRQELREHLRDAAAGHRAAGMSEEEALARALEDFGGPEQVRSELEATHGHRLLPVVIDKAMQWKEKTMKAKWLWATWAHLTLALLVALEVLFLTYANIFLVPRFEKLTRDGLIDQVVLREQRLQWLPSFLRWLNGAGDHTMALLLTAVAVWGLFEWRVRSENKSLMRLSALGTAAVGLMVAVVLTGASLTLPFFLGMPAFVKVSTPVAIEQMEAIDTSFSALNQAMAKRDWETLRANADRASRALERLAQVPYAIPGPAWVQGRPGVDERRERLDAASRSLWKAQGSIRVRDAERLDAALREFYKSYGPLRRAAKEPAT